MVCGLYCHLAVLDIVLCGLYCHLAVFDIVLCGLYCHLAVFDIVLWHVVCTVIFASAPKMDGVCSSQTFVSSYETTLRRSPEDYSLRRFETLRSRMELKLISFGTFRSKINPWG